KLFFIGFYQVPVLIKVSEKCFTNVATRRARHRVGTFFFWILEKITSMIECAVDSVSAAPNVICLIKQAVNQQRS
ncbi:MAG: hypothetical protein ACTJHK_10465, partial [Enterococcus viikkiensis]